MSTNAVHALEELAELETLRAVALAEAPKGRVRFGHLARTQRAQLERIPHRTRVAHGDPSSNEKSIKFV
jgi:hypothetical protein